MIFDTPPEPAFDQLTELAKALFDVPITLISLIDEERQWFKSCIGLDVDSTPRDLAFCDHVIRNDAVMIVTDASLDPRFLHNPLVTGAPHIRFYAGAPVRYQDVLIGTLCVIDRVARADFGANEALKLEKLAAAVSSVMAMRKDAMANIAIMRAREEDQKTLELVEDIAGVGQWSFDVKSGRVVWSDQVFRIHGLPITESAPDYSDVLALYDENDASTLARLVERAAKTGKGYTLEARIRRPNGAFRNVVAKAETLRGADGDVETIHGVFQDVTDYRMATEKARKSEARYRLLASNMPGMLGHWDSDLKCRFANNAYLEWFGRTPDELIGVHLKTVLGEELFALNEPFIRRALSGEKQTFERAISKASGALGYTLTQYLPDLDEDGRVRGFFVLVTDITDLKLKELALSDSNAQLIAARHQAEAALEIKAQFLATMSHEIRTPLTTILGYAGLLGEQDDLSQEAAAFVKRIGKAGRTLLALINDVLDVSRLEAGQVTLTQQAVNVHELARELVEQFQMQASTRNLKLNLDYDEELPEWQLIDDTRLTQVLNNLVGNACKFTSDGVISISMRAVENLAGTRMRVEVGDPGPGLTTEQTGKLFKRFQQLDAGINRKHGGSGLGLAICAEIIKLMQGEIGVVSSVTAGSTFWFEVPLTMAAPVYVDSEEPHFTDYDISDRKVLLVDDHAVNRQMIKALILPYAAEVAEACNGAEAIAQCQTSRFDLVFMDIQMPEIDGVAATKAIRATCPFNADTPIVALTAMTKSRLPDDYSESLFTQVLAKPIDPRKFHSVLAALPARASA
ncbi:sensory box protein [Asticcacaulis biprosthecium C19]|uniref:histidine kinase n=2 Tax=Asticcacaulis biprosthecium TaxID=76891 RepID=F4QSE8_9CAUL|nr:sensory box protein [Asticcacaulis biprosthecium C19]